MKPRPYVGITGFKHVSEVKDVADYLTSSYPPVAFIPKNYPNVMFGFTSSNKRLLDPRSEGGTSPKLESLWRLVEAVPKGHLPMIHYFTTSTDPKQIVEEVRNLFICSGLEESGCGLQLNLRWPSPDILREIKETLLIGPITLQLPEETLEFSTPRIKEQIVPYDSCADYLLIDPSGGLGKDINLAIAALLFKTLNRLMENTTIGLAGGFSAENVSDRVYSIAERLGCLECGNLTTGFCIDAQGKLRVEREIPSYMPGVNTSYKVSELSPKKTKEYLEGFFERIKPYFYSIPK